MHTKFEYIDIYFNNKVLKVILFLFVPMKKLNFNNLY